jgi:hypothetical protein
MPIWSRIFATIDDAPIPALIQNYLLTLIPGASVRFRSDDEGWFEADIALPASDKPFHLNRFLVSEEGIRTELNSWAAWLETREEHPGFARLMEHIVAAKQVFTLQGDPEQHLEFLECSVALCRFLAQKTAGIYQVDGQGFFDMDGHLLLRED